MPHLCEMYLEGVSTRKVKNITERLCGTSFSKSHVSELMKSLDEERGESTERNGLDLGGRCSVLLSYWRMEHLSNTIGKLLPEVNFSSEALRIFPIHSVPLPG